MRGSSIVDRSYAMSGKAVHGNQECPQPVQRAVCYLMKQDIV